MNPSSFGPGRVSAGKQSAWWTDFHHWEMRIERERERDKGKEDNS